MKYQDKVSLLAGLCDDEQYAHDMVEKMLSEYIKTNNVDIQLIHYNSAKQLLENKDKLDFLLLDIEMPEMDGIEAGYRLRDWNIDYKIIMLTAREDRYREAFKIGAFRFVSKPIDKIELYNAIDDVREHMIAFHNVTVYRDGIPYDIRLRDISYIEADRSATLIFTNECEFRSEYSLVMWKDILDDRIFFQCHKSFIVNMGKIEDIQSNVIQLANGDKVSVSRRLRTPLLHAYMEYDIRWR
jgi:DNA-binding LytR/AlgR family response regulator